VVYTEFDTSDVKPIRSTNPFLQCALAFVLEIFLFLVIRMLD